MATAAQSSKLPAYAPELAASHQAHHVELRQMIERLPILPRARVLDMACGDGRYIPLLAQRVGRDGLVVGADVSRSYLEVARRCIDKTTDAALVAAQIESLPFAEESFDLVWCAHSLVSFRRPEFALKQMIRLLRAGGWLAVLENDSLHEVLLPWPEELELAIRQAELEAYRAKSRRPDKRYIARRLERLLARAGLTAIQRETYPIDRCGPLGRAETEHLCRYLLRLRRLVWAYLAGEHREQFQRLTDAKSAAFLAAGPGFAMTWFEVVCYGQKAA